MGNSRRLVQQMSERHAQCWGFSSLTECKLSDNGDFISIKFPYDKVDNHVFIRLLNIQCFDNYQDERIIIVTSAATYYLSSSNKTLIQQIERLLVESL
jgi:hypothetical protein